MTRNLKRKEAAPEEDNEHSLRLPARLRLRFEQQLGEAGDAKTSTFKAHFEKKLPQYTRIIERAFQATFNEPWASDWFRDNKIEILTWHYKTRHPTEGDDAEGGWLSGQLKFNSRFGKSKDLEPFPGIKSPYIGIYANESAREESGMGGPICIALPASNQSGGRDDLQLYVPPEVTEVLKVTPPHDGTEDPLTEKDFRGLKKRSPRFIAELGEWMRQVTGEETSELKSLNHLMASLKVTLTILREYNGKLPRSTFLSPAYVAGEEVGGMAFACADSLDKETAFLGEGISTSLLTYLRLREDALAHHVAEEKEEVDQAKRFLINRFVHDFRHPVESLQSAVKEAKGALTSIEKQLSHVNRVMNETILAFEGRNPNELLKAKKRVDSVSEFFSDIRYFFKRRFEEVGKTLTFRPSPIPADWTVNIDRGMFHEVMENLLANALEHGGPHVDVEVEKHDDDYTIHVRDDGRGIPEKDWEGIFKAFYKRRTVIKDGRIRGRGMVISKLLAQAHGGTLRLEEGDDKWKTHFVVELPANGSKGEK